MPQRSEKQLLLQELHTALGLAQQLQQADLEEQFDEEASDLGSSGSSESHSSSLGLGLLFHTPIISPISPITPLIGVSDSSDGSFSPSDISDGEVSPLSHYDHFIDAIKALEEEVLRARVLRSSSTPLRAPQIQVLADCDDHPDAFRKKLRVDPDIFDAILDQIIDHPIFRSRSPSSPQLPVAVQLAIFLNRAGHYGNAISVFDVALWAGVSEGSVVNCTNRVMTALLAQHDTFIKFPGPDSADRANAKAYAGRVTNCQEWRGGWLAADGSSIPLFQKPGFYGETFYDRKSRYSLNCQVSDYFLSEKITTNTFGCYRQLLCLTIFVLWTMGWAIQEVHMMQMPLGALESLRSMRPFLQMMSGYGGTVPIPFCHGSYPPSKGKEVHP